MTVILEVYDMDQFDPSSAANHWYIAGSRTMTSNIISDIGDTDEVETDEDVIAKILSSFTNSASAGDTVEGLIMQPLTTYTILISDFVIIE